MENSKILKILVENLCDHYFANILQNILNNMKLHPSFSISIENSKENDDYRKFNFIFIIVSENDLDHLFISRILSIINILSKPRNHLFVIVNGDVESCENYWKFRDNLSKEIDQELLCIYRVPMKNDVVNWSEKIELVGNDIPLLVDKISKYFKQDYQKKIVFHNYLYQFLELDISFDNKYFLSLVREIYETNYFRSENYEEITDRIDIIFLQKLINFCDKNRNKVVTDICKETDIDAYTYYRILVEIMDVAKCYNLANILERVISEINYVGRMILEHYQNKMSEYSNLEKIYSVLEFSASVDKSMFHSLFKTISTNANVMDRNLNRMDAWVTFINKCLKLGIPRELAIELVEQIIMAKLRIYCNEISSIVGKSQHSLMAIYPLCLQTLLLPNIGKHFILKKLYMYSTCCFNSVNVLNILENLDYNTYHKNLILENLLVEMCNTLVEEQSQTFNISDIEIVETFNEKKNV
ncbi:MAG: hypothetical protein QXW79_00355 [Thermoplasmata archaeon]